MQSKTKIVGMLAPNAVFFRFWPVWNSGTVLVEQCPRPPKVGYRSELTNIGRARRQQSVPAIWTETMAFEKNKTRKQS